MKNYRTKIFQTLFVDIETVPQQKKYELLSSAQKSLWTTKATQLAKRSWLNVTPQIIEDLYTQKAAIYSEFGKIVCISVGMFTKLNGEIIFKKKSFVSDNEKQIIEGFTFLIASHFKNPDRFLFCGHNIREFDIPYICRRALINGVKLPRALSISGKKAWELKYLVDTLQLWKFGDYKNFASLELLCEIFKIPSPKSEIDGSLVAEYYYEKNEIETIREYCEKDVESVAFLYAKMICYSDINVNGIYSSDLNKMDVQ